MDVKVSQDQIERIREATNIVDLVSEHVRLKKRGRNFIGLCPFHNEKTPSFNVLEDRGIYKCFGCGKGGDAFSYVMQTEGLSFPEALKKLAKRANIEIEGTEAEEEEAARSERESLLNVLREAAAFYYHTLRGPDGTRALSYLHERGLEDEILRKFGLGFTSERSGMLISHLTARGFDTAKMEAAGLIARGQGGEYYERFRGRVIFPVFNATGRIVGFGGRILPGGKDLAKYINSPDTSVYHKSQILYGLYQAKDAIRKEQFAILVEGYADVLAIFQSGTENVVAASGTSLTAEQLQLLKRYTITLVLLFDADTAGKNATMRGIELAIEAGFDVSTVILAAGEDPDSLIRKNGAESFRNALAHRETFIEAKARIFEEQGAFNDPGKMAQAIRSIVETIAKVPDEIKRALFIQKLGEQFHLSEQMLSTELAKLLAANRNQEERRSNNAAKREADKAEFQESTHDDRHEAISPSAAHSSLTLPPSEGALLEAMLADPTDVAALLESSEFSIESVRNAIVRELLSYLIQRVEEEDPPRIEQLLDEYRERPEFESLLTQYGMAHSSFSENWDEHGEGTIYVEQARQAIAAIEREAIEQRKQELPQLVKKDPFSDDVLREVLALHEKPEMKQKLFQRITEEESHTE